jgi:hypothetical protein
VSARESTLRLSIPPEGIRAGDLVLRLPALDDVDAILPAFTDPELRDAGTGRRVDKTLFSLLPGE